MRKSLQGSLLAVTLLAGTLLGVAQTAQAADSVSPTITVSTDPSSTEPGSELIITLPPSTTDQEFTNATAELAKLSGGAVTDRQRRHSEVEVRGKAQTLRPARASLLSTRPATIPSKWITRRTGTETAKDVGSGSNPYPIACSSRVGSYSFTDANGNFTVQNNCASPHVVNWGYRISAATRSIVVGLVSEGGMGYTFVGRGQGIGAAHPNVVPDYFFHGTMGKGIVYNGGVLQYEDHFFFRHSIGGGGNADLRIYGHLKLVA